MGTAASSAAVDGDEADGDVDGESTTAEAKTAAVDRVVCGSTDTSPATLNKRARGLADFLESDTPVTCAEDSLPLRVHLRGDITGRMATQVQEVTHVVQLRARERGDAVLPLLWVTIHSGGGEMDAGMALHSLLRAYADAPHSLGVLTFASQMCESAAVLPFCAGDLRAMDTSVALMLHATRHAIAEETTQEILAEVAETDRRGTCFAEIMKRNVPRAKDRATLDRLNSSVSPAYLDAETCVDMGLATHVGMPPLFPPLPLSGPPPKPAAATRKRCRDGRCVRRRSRHQPVREAAAAAKRKRCEPGTIRTSVGGAEGVLT